MKILIYLIVLSILPAALNSQTLVQDSLTLVDLYNNTGGNNWTRNDNWLADPISTWYGITISGGRVTVLSLGVIGIIKVHH